MQKHTHTQETEKGDQVHETIKTVVECALIQILNGIQFIYNQLLGVL